MGVDAHVDRHVPVDARDAQRPVAVDMPVIQDRGVGTRTTWMALPVMHCIGRQTVGQTLSLFGSSVVQYAIFWYLVLRSNSGMVMTGAMVAAALPQAIVSMFGGVWADRWNRKLLVMLPDAVIVAVTICLSASMAVGWGDTGLILVVLVIRSAGGGIQTPAVQSFIPQIAPEAWLLRVNAINGTLQTAISIASPAIAAASST